MTLALLFPLGLAALAALALPLVIHLVRRLELQPTEFAALRWISERIRPRRRIRFERLWLLLVRLVLLALLAALLARPVMRETTSGANAWAVVVPGADVASARSVAPEAEWHWLAPGFPSLAETATPASVATSSLLRELDAELPRDTTLTVIAPAEIDGLDGERAQLSRAVDWRVVPGSMSARPAPAAADAQVLAVRYAPASVDALIYVRAAVEALNARGPTHYRLDEKPANAAIDDSVRRLVWLGAALPADLAPWVEAGGTALVDAAQTTGTPVRMDGNGGILARIEPRGRGRVIALAGALSPSTLPAVLDADFPERLADLLEGPPPAPTRSGAEMMRPGQRAASENAAAAFAKTAPLDPWLALAITLLFAIERIVATRAPRTT